MLVSMHVDVYVHIYVCCCKSWAASEWEFEGEHYWLMLTFSLT